MSEVILKIKTNKVGSTVEVGTGYTAEEWDLVDDADKKDIITEIVWESIEVWEEVEK